MAWVRVDECGLCGKDRCAVKSDNSKMGFCFRFGKTYFLNNGSVHYPGNHKRVDKPKPKVKDQATFDFNEDLDNHLDALSE